MDKSSLQDRYLFNVGVIVQQATGTDSILCWTLERVASIPKGLAEAVFYASDAFQVRRQLIQRVLFAVKADEETKLLVDEILSNVEKCNTKRNELAHASIGNTTEYPAGPVQFRAKLQTQKHRPVTDEYINSILAQASQATDRAWKAYEALTEKLPMPPQ